MEEDHDGEEEDGVGGCECVEHGFDRRPSCLGDSLAPAEEGGEVDDGGLVSLCFDEELYDGSFGCLCGCMSDSGVAGMYAATHPCRVAQKVTQVKALYMMAL